MFSKRSIIAAMLCTAVLSTVVLFGGRSVKADNAYFPVTPSNPFIQTWSNINQITTDDIWSGVASINGYRGDDPTTRTGINPETVLADYSGILDVNANRNDPNVFATGGVTEFDGIANPSIALKGSATADFPHIDIRLNTTGCPASAKLDVSYKVRDLDGSANDAQQQTAMHYRIGPTGPYTNIHTGFVFDATNPNTAERVSLISSGLPDETKGVPQLHVRVMTTNANGTDEWVGIDDIRVDCLVPTSANVSLSGRVSTQDGRGIANASVVITGNTLAAPMYTVTGHMGYYQFSNLIAGETYIVTVNSKRFTFDVPSRVVSLGDDVTDADFVAGAQLR